MLRLLRPMLLIALVFTLVSCGTGWNADKPEKLASVQYRFTYAFQSFDRSVIVTPEGFMEISQQKGANGPVLRVNVQLTPEQMTTIASRFKDWKKLKPFYSVIVGPIIIIEYDGYRVESSGGDDTPPNFMQAQQVLDQFASAALHVVYPSGDVTVNDGAKPTSRPVTLPGSDPATQSGTEPGTQPGMQP